MLSRIFCSCVRLVTHLRYGNSAVCSIPRKYRINRPPLEESTSPTGWYLNLSARQVPGSSKLSVSLHWEPSSPQNDRICRALQLAAYSFSFFFESCTRAGWQSTSSLSGYNIFGTLKTALEICPSPYRLRLDNQSLPCWKG